MHVTKTFRRFATWAALLALAGCSAAGGRGTGTPLMTLGGADGPGMGPLVEAARSKRAFVLGELHGFAENYEIALRLFKAMRTGAGYDVLALEVSFTDAESLNEYIETGNEFRLTDTSLFRIKTAGNSEEYFEFFRRLRIFWASLPVGKRFEIWGLDLCDTFPWVVRGHVTGRIMNLQDDDMRKAMLDSVPRGAVLDEEQVAQLAARLDALLGGAEGPKGAKDLKFFLLRLVDCFQAARRWWESHYGNRDRIWIEFVKYYLGRRRLPDEARVFVFCGARHARKIPVFEGESVFAGMFDSDVSGFGGRVFTALAYPLGAAGIRPPATLERAGRSLPRGNAALFPCADEDSPMRAPDSYPLLLSRPEPRALSDFYDAVILFAGGSPVRRR